MKFPKNIALNIMAAASMTLMLSACGSGDTASSSSSTGSLSLNITDAPVDMAQSVVVEFSGVELKPAEGKAITFDFTERCDADPASCQIDLLALNGGISAQLLADETVPAGKYNWLRLMVKAEDNVTDSYIMVDGHQHDLSIPSSAQTGLKLNRSFVVAADGESNFTIDFDLRKSVHKTGKGEYILRPTLRMVDHAAMGSLSGSIDSNLIATGDCTTGAAVYVFPADTTEVPDDEDGEAEDSGPDPITSTLVDADGAYNYKVSFLSAGDYLIAFTCDADLDDAEVDDDIATVNFLSTAKVTITVDNNTVHNFQP